MNAIPMLVETTHLSLAAIRRDGGTQPRETIDRDTTREYVEAMKAGARFPPVTLFFDGTDYWLADGFHRVEAKEELGDTEIEAEVRQGTRRDAVLHSVGTNATHGRPRTNGDKRRAATTLLSDQEWSAWSDQEIARRCAVTQPFVSKLRSSLITVVSEEVSAPSDTRRKYRSKSGTVAEMRTKRIGRSKAPASRESTKSVASSTPGKKAKRTPADEAPRLREWAATVENIRLLWRAANIEWTEERRWDMAFAIKQGDPIVAMIRAVEDALRAVADECERGAPATQLAIVRGGKG